MTKYKWDNKDPNDVLEYSINWSNVLESSETISDVTHTVSTITDDSNPLAIDTSKPSSGEIIEDEATKVWLMDGTAGKTYYVTSEIRTSASRVFNRKVKLKVRDL